MPATVGWNLLGNQWLLFGKLSTNVRQIKTISPGDLSSVVNNYY
jgi:hypothetical protein